MKSVALLLVGVTVGFALPLSLARPPEKPEPANAGAAIGRVTALKKERVAALTSAADISAELAKGGRVGVRDAAAARLALLAAEVEIAAKGADRVALYSKAVDAMKGFEEIALARKAAARGTDLDVFVVKAGRLEVEIALEEAKAKDAKAEK